jgi:hypothetical protein
MKVSIEKELEKKVQNEKATFDPIQEVKLLMESNEQEKTRILRSLSNNSQFNRVEKIIGNQLELEKLENSYDGRVYTIGQIKELCLDYNLRFLSSGRFTGTFDVEVAGKIIEFSKKTNTPTDEWSLKHSFFIMAPEEMFSLRDEKYITKKQLDPAIFYKIDDNHYKLVHKWGDDFTVFRLLMGYRFRSWWHHQWFNTVMVLPIFTLITLMLFGGENLFNHPISLSLFTITMSFLFSYFRWGWGKHDESRQIDGFFNTENWRSDSKIRR